jgi:Fungal specific transcription factor domain
MSADEVRVNFASEKKFIEDRYCFGVEQALARAGFLETCDLITLQAFVLYLTIVRCQGEARVGWALSRSAIAVAQSLGMHRDGSHFGLAPFECEMRRRLWWQLCVLDFRNSEKQGTEPSIAAGTYDTKLPLNINDSDLLPDATATPEPRIGLTEMTLTLIACELTSAVFTLQRARNNNAPLSSIIGSTTRGKDAIIQEFCQHLQDRYVKYCTDSNPMSWIVSNMCQLIIYKMESILLLPLMQAVSKPEIAKEASDQIFVKSIKIVELRRNLEVEKTKQWHWYIRTIVQWHAVAYLLSELCVREPDDNVTWAWNVLDTVFQDWKNFREQGAPGVLWLPMRKLIARARHKREADLNAAREAEAAQLQKSTHQNLNPDPNPMFSSTDLSNGINISESSQDLQHPGYRGAVGGYQGLWLQQPLQPHYPAASTPTPWLLEDSAMQELGLDMNGLDANMQWEGLDDVMQQFHPTLVEAPDTATSSSGGWDPLWWKMD